MALKFKFNQAVKQVVTPVEGRIVNSRIVEDEVQYDVAWTDADGTYHERSFSESELEAASADAPQ